MRVAPPQLRQKLSVESMRREQCGHFVSGSIVELMLKP